MNYEILFYGVKVGEQKVSILALKDLMNAYQEILDGSLRVDGGLGLSKLSYFPGGIIMQMWEDANSDRFSEGLSEKETLKEKIKVLHDQIQEVAEDKEIPQYFLYSL